MKKEISYEELKKRDFDKTLITNWKLFFSCKECGEKYETLVKFFLIRKKKVNVCNKCYFAYYVYDEEWRKKNSEAQKIAQNRPEVIEKHKQAQKERYQKGGKKLLEHYKKIGKNLWKNPEYRKKQIETTKENWKNPEYRNKVFTNSKKQYVGVYNNIRYYSLVELSFLFFCEEKGYSVKNYDGEGIEYFFNNKEHYYYPDFIINENTIVEVKGRGRWYQRDKQQIEAKFLALTEWCKPRKMKARLVFDKDIGKQLWKKAKEYYETEKEELQALSRKSL